ncbi:MAG TPA: PKD domain-containing protein, partial [Tepidisphaeraceae bacterium]|nr:PKD domain-containing protein [Tepidisphaeraceae bacterium]
LNGGGGGNHLIPANTGTVVHAGWHDVIDQPTGDAHDPTDVPTAPSKTPPTVGVPPVTTPPITPPPVTPTPPASNPGSGTGTKATDGTQAVITQLGTTVMVGEGVNVNGTSSTLGAGTDLTDIYQWNFGDPNSRFNTMTGWNAGHVYDNPGVYTITLTITDVNCQVSTATSKVTVTADNRPIIYVDTNGSDSNNGLSPSTPVKTAAKAFELAGSDSVIEFHRGEKFAVNQTLMINGNDMAVSTYGSGANPVLVRGVGDGSVTIFLTNKASNITVQNLTFDSIYPAVNGIGAEIPVVGVWAQGTNVVVRNCTFLNVEDAVEGNWGLNGVVVQDNSAPLMTGLRGYFCWVDGSNWTIDGNTVVNTTRQHVVRGNDQAIDSVEIAGNNFAKPLNPQDPGETMKCTVNFRGGSHIYVTGNVLNGVVSFGPDDYSDLSQNVSDVVIENNRITQQLDLIDGVHHFMVRNNVLQLDGTDQIYVKSVDTGVSGRYVTDITLTHNTGIDNATGGQFLYVAGNAQPGIITLTDNLFIAPHLQLGINMGASVLVDTPNLNAFSLISGNVWPAATGSNRDVPGAVNYAYGSWYADQGWLTATEWNSQSQVENDVFQTVLAPTDGNGIQTQFGPAGAIGYVPG